MSADAIASVVADLREGRVRRVLKHSPAVETTVEPVVDATAIYRSLVERKEPIDLYGDHPCIAPPWPGATVCYENEHGNVLAMTFGADDFGSKGTEALWRPAEPVLWGQVRWCIDTFVWVGGRGANGPSPTTGPVHMWRYAVLGDGTPADLHWVQLVPEYPMERWDMAHLVLLGVLTFLNCRNVDIVEPSRPRAERRRIERTGVRVHTINVFPVGKVTRGPRREGEGVPLHSVRGHFARYGPEYDRGLLFGKYSGRFFRPHHARGASEKGRVEQTFKIRADAQEDQ